MAIFYFLADLFINTFGITRPSEKARKEAALFIFALLVLVVAGAVTTFFVVHAYMK